MTVPSAEGDEFDTAACQLALQGQFFAIGEFDLDGFAVFMQDRFAAGDVVQDENVVIRRCSRCRFDDFVGAFATPVDVGIRTVAADQHVVAGATFDQVVAETAGNNVGTFAAHQHIVALAADKPVTSGTTHQRIVAVAAIEAIVAAVADEGVVASKTVDRLAGFTADQHVTGIGAVDHLAPFEAPFQIDNRQIVEGQPGLPQE